MGSEMCIRDRLNGGEVGVLSNYHLTLCDQYLAENLSGFAS